MPCLLRYDVRFKKKKKKKELPPKPTSNWEVLNYAGVREGGTARDFFAVVQQNFPLPVFLIVARVTSQTPSAAAVKTIVDAALSPGIVVVVVVGTV